jgi:hypothetical protein
MVDLGFTSLLVLHNAYVIRSIHQGHIGAREHQEKYLVTVYQFYSKTNNINLGFELIFDLSKL